MATREEVLTALAALVEAVSPGMTVLRDEPKEILVPTDGVIVVRAGSLLEADSGGYVGSPVFSATRLAVLEIAIKSSGDEGADRAALDGIAQALCTALAADPTLGGECGYAAGGQSVPDILTDDGAPEYPTLLMGVRLEYDAPFEALA